ncbi:hypothetical protein FKW77_006023 [Venturia effusa]|uniref:Uncharacterized protein n=1 Tax=Venturia effusa TaxID=50376 RepID=A0A517LP39_9PEZI|nr:hypothetical protein FKW77_006023 [Venturia effusa]
MESPHTKTDRKRSMRQQLKGLVKSSHWTALVKHKPDATRSSPSSPTKSKAVELPAGYDFLTNGLPSTNRKPARERLRRKQERQKPDRLDNQRHSLYTLQIEEPNLDDLRMSFEQGDDRWSVANPVTIQGDLEMHLAVGRGPAEKEVVDIDPLQQPRNIQTVIGSESSTSPSRVDSTRPESEKLPELKKPTRKWEVKTDNLARPVSRASGNVEAVKVSKTIESINKNKYSVPVMKEKDHTATASSYQKFARRGSEMAPEVVPPMLDEALAFAASEASNNIKALRTLGIESAEARAPKSNTPIAESMRNSSTFSFSINENLRRVAPRTTSTSASTSNRHSVGDMNKLLEDHREATSPIKQQPSPLDLKRSSSVGATSPTIKAESQPTTPAYRPRRVSGAKLADRMAWIRELEEKSSGKGSPGRAALYKNLQGGVADKLARFESSNKDSGSDPTRIRANSNSSRMSTLNDAYSIENKIGKRLSKASTMDDEFRRKLEEVAEKAKKKVDQEGDQEALIAQVNRDAELALKEEKRRSFKMDSAGPFKYAFDDKAGRQTDLVPDLAKTKSAVAPSTEEVDLESFVPTRRGSTKMPKFNVKDPNAVATSANPPATLIEKKPAALVSKLNNQNAGAASANALVTMDPQNDDGEYDPFNVMTYPVSKAMPAIKKSAASETQEEHVDKEDPVSGSVSIKDSIWVPNPETTDASQATEDSKVDAAESSLQIPEPELEELEKSQMTEKPTSETIEQDSRSEEDKATPAIEPEGIEVTEVKDEMKDELATEPAAAAGDKEVVSSIRGATTEVEEESKIDGTTQPTPKIEAKTSPIPIDPIVLEPPRMADDTKPDATAEPERAVTTKSPSDETSIAMQEDSKSEAHADLDLPASPSNADTSAAIPIINTTPPTPPAKKETPAPKYLALRERAQKAAEIPSKPAPSALPPSQTFSRLFGPPMTSGMGRSRSPSPVKAATKAESPARTAQKIEVPLKNENDAETEKVNAKTESAVPKTVSDPTPTAAEEEVPVPNETPATTDAPVERSSTIENDMSRLEAQKCTPKATETPIQNHIPTRKVTPFPTSIPPKTDDPIKVNEPIHEELTTPKADNLIPMSQQDNTATPASILTSNRLSTIAPLMEEEQKDTSNVE